MNLLQYFTGKKPSSFAIVTDPTIKGGKKEIEYRQCAHCGCQWEYKPGSGRKYGVCAICGGYTCMRKECNEKCQPQEEMLEMEEMRNRGEI